MNLVYNQGKLAEIVEKMARDGANKLHILADFDKTITETSHINGKPVGSIIGQLRAGGYLSPEYTAESTALFEEFHPFEHDQNIPRAERMNKMEEWWSKHNDLLIRSGLNKNDMDRVISAGHTKLRDGITETFKILEENNIPIVIMSGGPAYMIEKQLEFSGLLSDNVHIVANYYEYDENGFMTGYKKPIVHSQNKHEIILRDFPVFDEIKNRTNVILLGDQIDDLGMIEGFDYKNLLTVGFANKPADEEKFANKFDVLIRENGNFNFVNTILKQILQP